MIEEKTQVKTRPVLKEVLDAGCMLHEVTLDSATSRVRGKVG